MAAVLEKIQANDGLTFDDLLTLARIGNELAVKQAVEEDASIVYQTNEQGQTLLMMAADGYHPNLALYLLSKGSHLPTTDASGDDAVMHACMAYERKKQLCSNSKKDLRVLGKFKVKMTLVVGEH